MQLISETRDLRRNAGAFRFRTTMAGLAVRAGGDADNSVFLSQCIEVHGDKSATIGVRYEHDSSPLGDYTSIVDNCLVGVQIYGNSERGRYTIFGHKCRRVLEPVITPNNGTPDTIRAFINAAYCDQWYAEPDGSDTSIWVDLQVSARQDPGDGSPAIDIRNGKFTKVTGFCRGHNGDVMIRAFKPTSLGADTLVLDFDVILGEGRGLDFVSGRYLVGRLHLKDWKDKAGVPGPAVHIGRILSAANFSGTIHNCTATEGLHIGSEAYFPTDADLGIWDINMIPATKTAVTVEKVNGASLRLQQCVGGVVVGPGAQGLDLYLPARFSGTLSIDPAAQVVVHQP